MSIFKSFGTNKVLESEGVLIDYQDFRLRLRRSGGANKKYAVTFEKAMAPWRKKDISKEDIEVRADLLLDVFIEACYVDGSWETKVDGEFKPGIQVDPEGTIAPATKQNVRAILKLLPDLSRGLQAECDNIDNYLVEQTKAAVENLPSS